MSLGLIAGIGVGLYVLCMVAIGWVSGRKENHENYVIGGRNVGIIGTAASLGAGFRDVAFIAFWISFSYVHGWGIFTLYFSVFVILIIISRLAKHFNGIAKENNYVSPGHLIRDRIGPTSQKTYAGLIIFIALVYGAAQCFVLGSVLSATIDVPTYITIPGITLLVGFYLWQGGYGSVILSDIVQSGIIAMLFILPFLVEANPEHLYDWASFGSLGLIEILAMIAIPFVLHVSSPDLWQRIFSARDEKTILIGLPLGGLLAGMLTFVLVYLGISLRSYLPDSDPNALFILIFTEDIFAPWVLAIILVALFAMGMSTLDTFAYIFSSMMMRDIFFTSISNERETYITRTRILTIAYLIILTIIAFSFEDLLSVLMGLISLYALAAPLFWIILLGVPLVNRKDDAALSAILITSIVIFLTMHFNGFFGSSFAKSLIPVGIGLSLSTIWILGHHAITRFQKRA